MQHNASKLKAYHFPSRFSTERLYQRLSAVEVLSGTTSNMYASAQTVSGRVVDRPVQTQQVPKPLITAPFSLRQAFRSARVEPVTCATAASSRVKEAPEQIVQPAGVPRPLTNSSDSSSPFADALPSFGEGSSLPSLYVITASYYFRLLPGTPDVSCIPVASHIQPRLLGQSSNIAPAAPSTFQ